MHQQRNTKRYSQTPLGTISNLCNPLCLATTGSQISASHSLLPSTTVHSYAKAIMNDDNVFRGLLEIQKKIKGEEFNEWRKQ